MPASNAPETNRQRLIGLMYIILLCMLALNISSDVLGGFDLIENSLKQSAKNASAQNEALYKTFEKVYKSNPEKTEEWYTKAKILKQKSDSLFKAIQTLKIEVIKEADGKKADINNPKATDDLYASSTVLLSRKKKGEKLKRSIEQYRNYIVSMDNNVLSRKIILDNFNTSPSHKEKIAGKSWEQVTFEHIPMGAVCAILTKFQYDIRYAEGEILHILLNNIDVGDFRVNKISAYVIPNSKNIVKGDTYKAKIILAAEDSTQRPEIHINNKILPLSKNGQYSIPTNAIGTFPINGYIKIKKGDGEYNNYHFKESYTVVQPTATVSNTIMNVLYAGIKNRLSISVPGVPSKNISASANNGKLERIGNSWFINPTMGKTCTIYVYNNSNKHQLVSKSDFRIRQLPDPRAYIEYKDNKGNINKYKGGKAFSKYQLLGVNELKASVDDGLLNIEFTILSFNTLIYDSMGNTLMEISNGNKFSNRQKQRIKLLSRGKRLWISDIKAIGPDKITRILAPMEIIIK